MWASIVLKWRTSKQAQFWVTVKAKLRSKDAASSVWCMVAFEPKSEGKPWLHARCWLAQSHLAANGSVFRAVGLVQSIVTPPDASSSAPSETSWSKLAAQRLRHSTMVKTDDQIKWEASRKLKTIVLIDPSASKLGRSLMSGVRVFTTETNWETSFADAFEGKSVATLAKRAGSLWRFSEWAIENDLPPIVLAVESMVYRYLEHLKLHGSPTTASSFLEAWSFLHHCVGLLKCPLDDILSSRVRGASRACLARKRPLQQSQPLTAKMIVALENIVMLAPYDHWKIIAGHMLMCLGSSSRFGDTIRLSSLAVSEHEGLQLIEAESHSFKTSQTEERRLRLLPILSLGRFFAKTAWAQDWLNLRDHYLDVGWVCQWHIGLIGLSYADANHSVSG